MSVLGVTGVWRSTGNIVAANLHAIDIQHHAIVHLIVESYHRVGRRNSLKLESVAEIVCRTLVRTIVSVVECRGCIDSHVHALIGISEGCCAGPPEVTGLIEIQLLPVVSVHGALVVILPFGTKRNESGGSLCIACMHPPSEPVASRSLGRDVDGLSLVGKEITSKLSCRHFLPVHLQARLGDVGRQTEIIACVHAHYRTQLTHTTAVVCRFDGAYKSEVGRIALET